MKETVKKAKFLGVDSARRNRMEKREEIRTSSLFGGRSQIDVAVAELKKKLGHLPAHTRKLLKSQMKVFAFINFLIWLLYPAVILKAKALPINLRNNPRRTILI